MTKSVGHLRPSCWSILFTPLDVLVCPQHPGFNWNPADGDDVGVMHLTTTLDFGESIQAITVSEETDISVWADNTDCWITGWGVSK